MSRQAGVEGPREAAPRGGRRPPPELGERERTHAERLGLGEELGTRAVGGARGGLTGDEQGPQGTHLAPDVGNPVGVVQPPHEDPADVVPQPLEGRPPPLPPGPLGLELRPLPRVDGLQAPGLGLVAPALLIERMEGLRGALELRPPRMTPSPPVLVPGAQLRLLLVVPGPLSVPGRLERGELGGVLERLGASEQVLHPGFPRGLHPGTGLGIEEGRDETLGVPAAREHAGEGAQEADAPIGLTHHQHAEHLAALGALEPLGGHSGRHPARAELRLEPLRCTARQRVGTERVEGTGEGLGDVFRGGLRLEEGHPRRHVFQVTRNPPRRARHAGGFRIAQGLLSKREVRPRFMSMGERHAKKRHSIHRAQRELRPAVPRGL